MDKQKINSSKKQEFAVIGLGRFGSSLAITLTQNGYMVLGIDRSRDVVQHLSTELAHVIAMDTTDEAALKEAGVHHFDTVIVAIGSDFENNLLTTAALRALGTRRIICKAMTDRQRNILLKIGADQVVLPEADAGQRLAQELVSPSIFSSLHLSEKYDLVERRTPAPLAGLTLAEANIRQRYGVTVLVISRDDHLIVSPKADTRLIETDMLVLLGSKVDLGRFSAAY